MMDTTHAMEQERSVLRWGGLAGMLGGAFHILTFLVVIMGPVGIEEPAELVQWVTRFPDIMAARIVENLLYLAALVLGFLLFLALYRALRRDRPAAALFGSVLGILGLVVLAAGALPHVATAPLSDLYHAPGASRADQAALALMWQAAWGIFEALLAVGFFILPVGLIVLGAAMLGDPAFGRGYGWLSLVLGAVGLAAAVLNIIDPASMIAAATFFAIIIYKLALGWKVYSLSRASQRV